GFAGAGQAREHHELVAGNLDVDVLQVVLAGAANGDRAQAARGLLASRFQNFIHYRFSGQSCLRKTCLWKTLGTRRRPPPPPLRRIGRDRAPLRYSRNVGRTAAEFQSGIAPINRFANRWQQRSACQRFREGTYHAKTKRPAGSPAFSDNCWSRSVSRNHRAPEGVVEANGAHVHVLVDVVDAAQAAANKIEGDVAAAHEQVIVFEGNRPARCEADFKTGANRATPAALAGVVEDDAEELAVVLVVCD